MIYNPNQAKVAGEIIHRLATDAKLKLEGYEAAVDMEQNVPAQLLQTLNRSASCVVFLDEASSWDITALQQELRERVQQHSLRLIFLQLSERKVLDDVDTEVVNWDNEDNWKDLEAAIVGYRQTVVNYPIDAEIPDELKLGSTISGTFLPPDTYTERPEQHQIQEFWQDEERNGVLSLIGIGGSGKTTLLLRFLETLPDHPLSNPEQVGKHNLNAPNGVFLWSFYDNPNIEYFIRGLYEYLTGEATFDAARDVTYRLIRYLEENPKPHFLVALDGLEIVQEDRDSSGGFGLLRDSSLRHLVRRIARGDLPIKMIITSRYPLPELQPFESSSYWSIDTNTLDNASALEFLRERDLTGKDEELAALITEFGSHCLTLDHLARVLTAYFDGNLRAVDNFVLPEGIADDAQAIQLARVLATYQRNLSEEELAILQIVSIIGKPVSLNLLIMLMSPTDSDVQSRIQFTPDSMSVDEILVKLRQIDTMPRGEVGSLQQILGRLQALNLITFYGANSEQVCTIHPAIREFFTSTVNGIDNFHYTIAKRMIKLATKHDYLERTSSLAQLEIYARIIAHVAKTSQPADAVRHYEELGGYQQLAWRLSQYQFGLHITETLVDLLGSDYVDARTAPVYENTLFLLNSGQPHRAEIQALELLEYIETLTTNDENSDSNDEGDQSLFWLRFFRETATNKEAWYKAMVYQTLGDALVAQGKLIKAEQIMTDILSKDIEWAYSGGKTERFTGSNPYGRLAVVQMNLGKSDEALQNFVEADRFAVEHVRFMLFKSANWYHKAFHARLLARLGKLSAARKRLESIKIEQMRAHRPLSISQYDLTAAEIAYLSGDQVTATKHIETALAWSMQSGHQHVYAQSQIQLARQHLLLQNHENAKEALSEAIKTSSQSNFNLQLADALVLSGHLALEGNNSDEAEEYGTEALDISERLSYRWGSGDAAYLLAKAQHLKGNSNNALEYAQKSLDVRQFIQDPRAKHTQKLIQSIQSN